MSSPICIDRDRGYEEALTAGGIKRDPALTVNGDFSVESGIRGVEICSRSADATAAPARTTRWRSERIRAIKSRGRSVPEDVSVVGSTTSGSRATDPPGHTIAQPMEDLGREAMSLLLEILNRSDAPARKRILPTQLVVRGSTAPAPRSKR